jgi:hypothetical protein
MYAECHRMPYACVIHSPTIELSSCCRWDLQDHKCPAETLAVGSCWIMLDRCATVWYVLSRSLYQCGWKCRMARLQAERRGEMTGHPETSALIQACLWIIAHVDLVFCVQPAINSKPFSPRRILPNPFNYFNYFNYFNSSFLYFPIHPIHPVRKDGVPNAREVGRDAEVGLAFASPNENVVCQMLPCFGMGRWGNVCIQKPELSQGCRIVVGFFWPQVLDFCLAFFPGTICLVFATVWN